MDDFDFDLDADNKVLTIHSPDVDLDEVVAMAKSARIKVLVWECFDTAAAIAAKLNAAKCHPRTVVFGAPTFSLSEQRVPVALDIIRALPRTKELLLCGDVRGTAPIQHDHLTTLGLAGDPLGASIVQLLAKSHLPKLRVFGMRLCEESERTVSASDLVEAVSALDSPALKDVYLDMVDLASMFAAFARTRRKNLALLWMTDGMDASPRKLASTLEAHASWLRQLKELYLPQDSIVEPFEDLAHLIAPAQLRDTAEYSSATDFDSFIPQREEGDD